MLHKSNKLKERLLNIHVVIWNAIIVVEQDEKKLRCKKQEERLSYWMQEYQRYFL